MVGGDLKFHLNKDGRFDVSRSRFYGAQILLGLEHIHNQGIVYRDVKLENVLLDNHGHCKISDLGLAVKCTRKRSVTGYAGTPGYTAPEVCLQQYYDQTADYFSYGVLIYRFLSGKKPFQPPRKKTTPSSPILLFLLPNVLAMNWTKMLSNSIQKQLLLKDPERRLGANGIQEIKEHVWFDSVDFGLIEAGYVPPPFVPKYQDEINADSLRHIGRPESDEKYSKANITPEFDASLRAFPFVSKSAVQDEMVTMLSSIPQSQKFQDFATQQQLVDINSAGVVPDDTLPPLSHRLLRKQVRTQSYLTKTTKDRSDEVVPLSLAPINRVSVANSDNATLPTQKLNHEKDKDTDKDKDRPLFNETQLPSHVLAQNVMVNSENISTPNVLPNTDNSHFNGTTQVTPNISQTNPPSHSNQDSQHNNKNAKHRCFQKTNLGRKKIDMFVSPLLAAGFLHKKLLQKKKRDKGRWQLCLQMKTLTNVIRFSKT
ncbi:hypothetical protein RFI_22036 [Reticulomyxa filosa]|uniref:Protein kinase domain-containing protein n=1 Tax=Reticulomyxa filosa TaxID=46433 RepID=X6MMV2_RETFI|nr:hypothetical protein RFI_22036 [Reticulomyxa filosa]|eukprot:ETO15328.1 hypothetical protein RFI_22036 [Reticulomyxa filosa]